MEKTIKYIQFIGIDVVIGLLFYFLVGVLYVFFSLNMTSKYMDDIISGFVVPISICIIMLFVFYYTLWMVRVKYRKKFRYADVGDKDEWFSKATRNIITIMLLMLFSFLILYLILAVATMYNAESITFRDIMLLLGLVFVNSSLNVWFRNRAGGIPGTNFGDSVHN